MEGDVNEEVPQEEDRSAMDTSSEVDVRYDIKTTRINKRYTDSVITYTRVSVSGVMLTVADHAHGVLHLPQRTTPMSSFTPQATRQRLKVSVAMATIRRCVV